MYFSSVHVFGFVEFVLQIISSARQIEEVYHDASWGISRIRMVFSCISWKEMAFLVGLLCPQGQYRNYRRSKCKSNNIPIPSYRVVYQKGWR